LEVK
jgi:hypothetical protein